MTEFDYVEFFKQLQRQSDEALLKALRRAIDDWKKRAEQGTHMWDYITDEQLSILYDIDSYAKEEEEKDEIF